MPQRARLTPECVERLRIWIEIKCPCALEDYEFLPGLWVIIEDEVAEALAKPVQERPSLN